MGFDLSGLKPKIEEGTTEPVIDWDKEPSEEEKTTLGSIKNIS